MFFTLLFTAVPWKGWPSDGPPFYGDGRILLQTDRKVYVAGENMFYKLYMTDPKGTVSGNGEFVYLVLRNARSSVITHSLVRIYGDRAWGDVYLPDTLSTGMYQLLAYTNAMRNEGAESFATQEIFVANRFDKGLSALLKYTGKKEDTSSVENYGNISGVLAGGLSVVTEKKIYGCRERIGMEIRYDAGEADPVAFVSVSVAEEPAFFTEEPKRPGEGAKGTDPPERSEDPMTGRRYLPESRGYILRGTVYDEDGKPAKGAYVLLSVPDTLINLDYAVTDSTGMFRLLLNDHCLGKKIILMPAGSPGKKIVPDDKYRIREAYRPTVVHFSGNIREYLLKSQKIVGVRKIYGSKYVHPEKRRWKVQETRPVIYSHPDFTLLPSEYVPLRDLPEIAKEIVPYLKIRKNGDGFEVRVYNEKERVFFRENATVFLDGVPVKDPTQLMPLASGDIRRIELMEKLWFCGDVRFNGIVAVFSTNHALDRYRFPADVLTLKMEAPAAPSGMIMPRYEDPQGKEGRVPDLRQLLCWQPDLVLKKDQVKTLSFFSSDLSGDYIIRVTGLTAKGREVVAVSRFTVRRNGNEGVITEYGGGGK